ncbi:MAG TPA: DUF5666 domain-containing protein [Thermoanaerobaculia bacterium]|nr:DUF5666 domain-containing protein [Thermoanaerobaculia bacterium]
MKLHRLIITSIVALAIAATAFAHGGHKHQFLGTVKALSENQLVVTTTEKRDVTFTLTEKTTYSRGTSAATRNDLQEGVRVSVYVENDGRTARTVKIAR